MAPSRGEIPAELADKPFHCEVCQASHPLAEHQACRDAQAAEWIRQAHQAARSTT